MSLRRRLRGFSYVEMLVVLLIGSAISAAAIAPIKSYLEGRKRAKCADNMHKLQLVMALYANEHNGAYPVQSGAKHSDDALALLVPKYTSDPDVFACPVCEKKKPYSYVMGVKREDASPLMADTVGAHAGAAGNILFCDGHLETFAPDAPRFPKLPAHATVLEPQP